MINVFDLFPLVNIADDDLMEESQSQSETNMDYDDDDVIHDCAPTDNEDLPFKNHIQPSQAVQQETPLGMDEQLVTAFEPGEYSYFKQGAITWEGPNHWKMKLNNKAPSSGMVWYCT